MGTLDKRRSSGRLALIAGMTTLAMLATTAAAFAAKTEVANKTNAGVQTVKSVELGDISATGRFVVFATDQGIAARDKNGDDDIYLRDMVTKKTYLISRSTKGKNGDGPSWDPVVNATGQFVAFSTDANNLIDGKDIGWNQIYVRDRKAGRTYLISRGSKGPASGGHSDDPHVSAGGRFVVFDSYATNLTHKNTGGHQQVYLRDRKTGNLILVSKNNAGTPGNGDSWDAAVSPGGRFITFVSDANSLTAKSDGGHDQIYMHDRKKGKTWMVSVSTAGVPGNHNSSDPELGLGARRIAFETDATNFANDTNGLRDIYIRQAGKTTRVSKTWDGKQLSGGGDGAADPDISANGRWLTYETDATNASKAGNPSGVDMAYVRDLKTGKQWLVSRNGGKIANGTANDPQISDNGRWVILQSAATNLIPGGDTNGTDNDALRRGPYN